MKRRLREVRTEISYNTFKQEIQNKVEYILWLISQKTSTSSTTGTSGESFNVPTVKVLPPIPTDPGTFSKVFWTSSDGGSGDNQCWETYAGRTRWIPSWKPTSKSGVPV